jgi:hypothetical protein
MMLYVSLDRGSDHDTAHFNHQATGSAYNGIKPTVDQLIQEFGSEDKNREFPTLNRTCEFSKN